MLLTSSSEAVPNFLLSYVQNVENISQFQATSALERGIEWKQTWKRGFSWRWTRKYSSWILLL